MAPALCPPRFAGNAARTREAAVSRRGLNPTSERQHIYTCRNDYGIFCDTVAPHMTDDIITRPRTRAKPKVERPKLYKVILLNDDYTPREFVVRVLKAEFRVSEDQAHHIMITAHRRGVCVVAVFTRDVAETKATRATDAGKAAGYPLTFTTEPEE